MTADYVTENVETLADALNAAWSDEWANKPNGATLRRLATALIDSGAVRSIEDVRATNG